MPLTGGGIDQAVAALDTSADPVVRIALVEAMAVAAVSHRDGGPWSQAVIRVRVDPVPAVRLVANVEALRVADAAAWPAVDAAIRADLAVVDGVLGAPGSRSSQTAGERWALALACLGREHDCCAWAERLADPTEPPAVRLAGVDLAVEAMRTWRAAPARLAPTLAGMLTEDPSAVRSAAVRALSASVTATRLAADELAGVLDEPEIEARVATALGSVGDRRAVAHLVRLLRAGDPEPRLAEALTEVARAGADPAVLVAVARQVLAAHRDPCRQDRTWRHCPAVPAMGALAALGPAAADAVADLIARIDAAIDRDDVTEPVFEMHVLARIGPAAEAAVPLMRRYVAAGGSDADLAVRALLMITLDRAVADRFLAERPEQPRRCRIAPALLTWLADHGGLTDRQHRQLRYLFTQPGAMQVRTAGALWRCEGPSVAGQLLEQLPKYVDDDAFGPEALRVLAAMGAYARPILDQLDHFVRARRRAAVYLGNADAEMRADESLLAAAISARDRIAASTPR